MNRLILFSSIVSLALSSEDGLPCLVVGVLLPGFADHKGSNQDQTATDNLWRGK